jgi:protein gp37
VAETKIEWTDATWNPVAGCSIVTAGCTHCYAMEMARRLEAMGMEKYSGLTRKTGNRTVWSGLVREDRGALALPHAWKKPRKIFVNSMSDLFHEQVTDDFILAIWDVMRATPRHNYQILTKRPERMVDVVLTKIGAVLPNVWLGTSVENADTVDRINYLRDVPAAIRFISFEPLIGAVGNVDLAGIDWAIVGGESGRSVRPTGHCVFLQAMGNLGQGQQAPFQEGQRPGVSWAHVGRDACGGCFSPVTLVRGN